MSLSDRQINPKRDRNMSAETDILIQRAAAALKTAGAREIYVFGSAAHGTETVASPSPDLAVSGLPPTVLRRMKNARQRSDWPDFPAECPGPCRSRSRPSHTPTHPPPRCPPAPPAPGQLPWTPLAPANGQGPSNPNLNLYPSPPAAVCDRSPYYLLKKPNP